MPCTTCAGIAAQRSARRARGRTSLFTCRYHGWSYRTNGELAAWRQVPEGLEKSDYGLRRCGVAIFQGIILISLEPDAAPDCTAMLRHTESRWARFDLARCKVAVTQTYLLKANWKLAIENNLECYHCLTNHPQYTAANAFVKADEKVSDADVTRFAEYHTRWKAGLEGTDPARCLGAHRDERPGVPRRDLAARAGSADGLFRRQAARAASRHGHRVRRERDHGLHRFSFLHRGHVRLRAAGHLHSSIGRTQRSQ